MEGLFWNGGDHPTMSPASPFIDPETGSLDLAQIRDEALPLLGLVLLVVGVALVPFLFVVLLFGNSILGLFFSFLTQLVLAVGTGIVLIYVVARGVRLADA